jgi:hypothetical protein
MNTEPCGGVDNEGDGCGVVFARRILTGPHCPLCKKLKVPGLSAEAKVEIEVCGSLYQLYTAKLLIECRGTML